MGVTEMKYSTIAIFNVHKLERHKIRESSYIFCNFEAITDN